MVSFIYYVVQLQAQLKCEEALNRVLRCALHGPVLSLPLIPPLFPPQVRGLLEELAMVVEEIIKLERKDSSRYGSMITEQRSSSLNYEVISKGRKTSNRRASLGSALDFHSLFSTPRRSTEYEVPRRSSGKIAREYPMHIEDAIEKPNELLEELLKCLIGIFLELNRASLDREESEKVPRLALPCMKFKFLDLQAEVRILDQHLQCLHNECTAFLHLGLPSTQEKLLSLMNKAAMNVGGIVLNALAIEHFILRHPCESKHGGS
ncbi:hypothetical protein HKD37_02G005594 [Glycine soja]